MRRRVSTYKFLLLLLFLPVAAHAQEKQDSVRIYFRQSIPVLELNVGDNRRSLDRIAATLGNYNNDSVWTMRKVEIVGGASPEGTVRFNRWLSERRAEALFNYLADKGDLPDTLRNFTYLGRDWGGLIALVEEDAEVPYRVSTLEFLHKLKKESDAGDYTRGDQAARFRKFKGGRPWRYLYNKHFPQLRSSKLTVWYERKPNPLILPKETVKTVKIDTVYVHDTIYYCPDKGCKPFYMAVKTNMLYDALLLPNIGVEFYLGKNISIAANWMYAWWKCDHKHNYWRAYGGDAELRYWFGPAAAGKPLTGHHAGIYAQMLTYDFELGKKGYLAPRWNYGGGVSYGYALPLTPRLNIDFTIGIGYQGGKYKKYKPVDGCYVWQSTHRRNWIGPTKAEISLMWLIGCDNINRDKVKSKPNNSLQEP